jgi:hypothetical protein
MLSIRLVIALRQALHVQHLDVSAEDQLLVVHTQFTVLDNGG